MVERHRGGGAHVAPTRGIVLRGVVELLAVDGIVLRDLEQGLVDFPATAPSGRDHWLCWVSGEERVEWWHWPEDGFAGRTPRRPPARVDGDAAGTVSRWTRWPRSSS